nr:uncharacterized protein LOC109154451 [Ipomoea trifida]
MYQGNNQQREEPPKESMEDKMVRMFSELRHDVTNMRQEWKQDLRQEISTIRQEVSNLRQENNASLRNLETQVAQNSKALAERPQGTLPSTTVNNPRERVQAVTLRSGKELPEPTLKKNTVSKSPIEEEKIEEIIELDKEQEKETSSLPSSPKATQSRDKGKEKVDLPMAITGKVSTGEEEREKKKVKTGEKRAWAPDRTSARPAPSGWVRKPSGRALKDASRTRVRPASDRGRYRSKARNADASGRIRPDFARHLPNEEEIRTPRGRIRPDFARHLPNEEEIRTPRGRIRPDFARHLPNEEKSRTPGGRTRPPRVRCYGKSREKEINYGRPPDARPSRVRRANPGRFSGRNRDLKPNFPLSSSFLRTKTTPNIQSKSFKFQN